MKAFAPKPFVDQATGTEYPYGHQDIPQALYDRFVAAGYVVSENPQDPSSYAKVVNDPATGGVGILGPNGEQIAGNGAPYAFTSRALTKADNGMIRTCSAAQVATVNTGLIAGFATLFDGPVSFNGTATITDDRDVVSGKNYCALYAIGVDTYRVVGKKGA